MPVSGLGETPAALPGRQRIDGQRVSLVPLDAEAHAAPLFKLLSERPELWRYMFDAPPVDEQAFHDNLEAKALKDDQIFYTIVKKTNSLPVGVASYLRIEPMHRVIEVGNIMFSPQLQRTPEATEAMYLMAKYAFEELGYRRYEWKCNALNEPSRKAALRLGFAFEGIFRQHMIIKGENRDTAWFAMLDGDWPRIKTALEAWLAEENFDAQGRQKHSLAFLRE
jgi:RimJ/RimL family protein N-acetyltransferase